MKKKLVYLVTTYYYLYIYRKYDPLMFTNQKLKIKRQSVPLRRLKVEILKWPPIPLADSVESVIFWRIGHYCVHYIYYRLEESITI